MISEVALRKMLAQGYLNWLEGFSQVLVVYLSCPPRQHHIPYRVIATVAGIVGMILLAAKLTVQPRTKRERVDKSQTSRARAFHLLMFGVLPIHQNPDVHPGSVRRSCHTSTQW